MSIVRLALTLGEPAGIGPDICLYAAQQSLPAEVIVVGSPDLLLARARQLGLSIELYEWQATVAPAMNGKGRLAIVPVDLPAPCVPGVLSVENASYVLNTLSTAHTLCMEHACHALVTGPVHKAIVCDSGVPFLGHTEYLAQLAGVPDVLMTFYTPEIILAMLTTHIPLHAVSAHITAHRLTRVTEILHQGLTSLLECATPQIHVCGLNPHAGENGRLGTEEIDIIIPTLDQLRKRGMDIIGPVSADTAFAPSQRAQADAMVAMYHDQGLAPLKALYFNNIVNVTMGLPYLRTSVDHGTALDLAGSGQASAVSLLHAITLATKWATRYV